MQNRNWLLKTLTGNKKMLVMKNGWVAGPRSMKSIWRTVTSGVSQELILGQLVSAILINDLENKTGLSEFRDDTKVGGVADSLEGCATIQKHWDRLES